MKKNLWNLAAELKSEEYQWTELSYVVSPETPHWRGFRDLSFEKTFEYHDGPYEIASYNYDIVSQYGTHIDCPRHFVADGRTLDMVDARNVLFPLCILLDSDKFSSSKI